MEEQPSITAFTRTRLYQQSCWSSFKIPTGPYCDCSRYRKYVQKVKVKEQEQDSLRFLWRNRSTDDHPDEYVMIVYIYIYGATAFSCITNLISKRTPDDNESDFDLTTFETLRRNFYVDDVLRALPKSDAAIKLLN